MTDTIPVRRPRFTIAVASVLSFAVSASAHAACAGAGAVPSGSNTAKVRKATLCLLNVQRRAHGLQNLRQNAKLRTAAAGYSRQMVRQSFFSHESPDGTTLQSRVTATHYLDGAHGWGIGENIAWGTGGLGTPRSIVRTWMHSPGHRANILNATFRDIGIGIAAGAPIPHGAAATGGTYTTDFGYRG
jgi:uncharacterized protein YkwD